MNRRAAALLLLVLVGTAATVTYLKVKADREAARETERAQLLAYVEAIRPHAERGGEIVVTEIRPRLGELRNGIVAPDQFVREAQRWHTDLEEVRQAFLAAPSPAFLDAAEDLYNRSLIGYIAAVDELAKAASGPKESLETGIQRGITLAETADKTYDKANAAVEAEAKRLGIESKVG